MRRYKQDRSKNVYQKVKMKTQIMQSNEAKITVTKLIMVHYKVACTALVTAVLKTSVS